MSSKIRENWNFSSHRLTKTVHFKTFSIMFSKQLDPGAARPPLAGANINSLICIQRNDTDAPLCHRSVQPAAHGTLMTETPHSRLRRSGLCKQE